MKRFPIIFSLFVLLLLSGQEIAVGQQITSAKYAKSITKDEIRKYIEVLASDSLEGRETGTLGQKKAAAYLAGIYTQIRLDAPEIDPFGEPYIQPYPLQKGKWKTIYLEQNAERKIGQKDFIYYSSAETSGEEVIDCIWLGDADTLTKNIENRFVVFTDKGSTRWQQRIDQLAAYGAIGFIVVKDDGETLREATSQYASFMKMPVIKPSLATDDKKILVAGQKFCAWLFGKPYTQLSIGDGTQAILNADRHIENIGGENVIGLVTGTKFPEEVVIVSAHYDHLGVQNNETYYGADDNGSGTAALLEIAEAFVQAKEKGFGPLRTVMFVAFSGEEKGLLGSEYYRKNPVYAHDKTQANLNIDMIGRTDAKHTSNHYVYLIGSDRLSTDLHELSEYVNTNTLKMDLDYNYNNEADPNRFYYRSDHYSFAQEGVPVIFYFSGTHQDYHQPTDTIEKLDFDKIEKTARLIFFTAWEIANRPERIKRDTK